MKEKTVIALAIQDKECCSYLLSNGNISLFKLSKNQTIFEKLKKLFREERPWPVWKDLAENTDPAYLNELFSELNYMPRAGLIEHMKVLLKDMKKDWIRKRVLSRIYDAINRNDFEIEDISRLVEMAMEESLDLDENCSIYNILEEYIEMVINEKGYLLGYKCFDDLTDKLRPGELVVIMGRPTTGKTFFSLNILKNLVRFTREKIIYFSLEMPKAVLIERILQLELNLPRQDIKELSITNPQILQQALEPYKNVRIYDKTVSTADIDAFVLKVKPKIIFIDFLTLIRSNGEGSTYQKTTEKMENLKRMAKDRNCLIILLCQLSRIAGDGSKPVTLDSARESGVIEELADFVYALWRPAIDPAKRPGWENKVIIALLKNKRGATDTFVFNVSPSGIWRFEDERVA